MIDQVKNSIVLPEEMAIGTVPLEDNGGERENYSLIPPPRSERLSP